MLGKFNPTVLMVFLLLTLLIGIIIGIIFFIKSVISLVKTGDSLKLKYNLVCILCILVAIAAWIFNFGWLRFIFTFLAIPVIHTIALMLVTNFALSHIEESPKIKWYIILSYVTYLLSYLLLPDSGDSGPGYMFFSLIHNDIITDICYDIAISSFICNIGIMVIQLIETIQIKIKNKKQPL